jgi:hypothetical protein
VSDDQAHHLRLIPFAVFFGEELDIEVWIGLRDGPDRRALTAFALRADR